MPLATMYVVGPLVAFAVIGGLALVLRWTFSGQFTTLVPDRTPGDFGLLRPVATVDDRTTARALRQLLGHAGIRATIAPTPDGRVHVLVFESELDRARRLAGGPI